MFAGSLESQAESCAGIVLSKSAEFWEEKNEAMIKLTKSIKEYTDESNEVLNTQFTPQFFKFLVEPLRAMIADLRSQQVKEACNLITAISEASKDRMKVLLREIYVTLFDAIKVPHKLTVGHVDDTILSILRIGTFRFFIPHLVQEIGEHKSSKVRERFLVCIMHMNKILSYVI